MRVEEKECIWSRVSDWNTSNVYTNVQYYITSDSGNSARQSREAVPKSV